MHSTNNKIKQDEAACCVDHCMQKFEGSANEIVNVFKCNQKQFSVSESWNIQKNKKKISIRQGL